MQFVDYRAFYRKTGRLRYISHLDVNRLMQRSLKRSLLPAWYTEGFNPHIYLTFALPLALGVESRYEVMDFRLTKELPEKEIARRLQSALPPDIEIIRVAKPVCRVQDIGYARFVMTLSGDEAGKIAERWKAFAARGTIPVEKKTKRGTKLIDLRPDLRETSCREEGGSVILEMLLPAGVEKNISPFLVLEAFSADSGLDRLEAATVKTEVLCKNGDQFA